jgi:hypothetical protein
MKDFKGKSAVITGAGLSVSFHEHTPVEKTMTPMLFLSEPLL